MLASVFVVGGALLLVSGVDLLGAGHRTGDVRESVDGGSSGRIVLPALAAPAGSGGAQTGSPLLAGISPVAPLIAAGGPAGGPARDLPRTGGAPASSGPAGAPVAPSLPPTPAAPVPSIPAPVTNPAPQTPSEQTGGVPAAPAATPAPGTDGNDTPDAREVVLGTNGYRSDTDPGGMSGGREAAGSLDPPEASDTTLDGGGVNAAGGEAGTDPVTGPAPQADPAPAPADPAPESAPARQTGPAPAGPTSSGPAPAGPTSSGPQP